MKKYGEYAKEMKERIAKERAAKKVGPVGILSLSSIEPEQVTKYGLRVGQVTRNSRLLIVE